MRAKITITKGGNPVRICMLDAGQSFDVGRGRDVEIQLKGLGVSRRHLTIELREDGVFVTDLGSSNGTELDGKLIEPKAAVSVPNEVAVSLGPYAITCVVTAGELTRGVSGEQARVQELVAAAGIEVRYQVGRGGTGTVWAGWQQSLARMVAVKVLDVFDPEDKQRFIREGRVSARIKSPNVVKLFDFRMPQQGRPFLVMELVSGMSALERLRDGVMPIDEALRVGIDMTRAMAALEEVGVIHRDIKPSNILLSPDGVAKLSDFGIARDLKSDTNLTQAGVGLGTFSYMAPEQFQEARLVDQTADVYGLGATLYHLIAGQPPFYYSGRGNPADFVERILNDPPVLLSSLRAEVPESVCAYINQMLAKEPSVRPQTAGAVNLALKQIVATHYDSDQQRRLTESSGDTWTE